MANWHKGSISSKKIDVKLRLRQMCDDIDEMVEYINEEEENIENIDSSEIKILVEGARAVLDFFYLFRNLVDVSIVVKVVLFLANANSKSLMASSICAC